MISVQNHQQLLSGNKIWIALLLVCFITSCDLFRKAQDTEQPADETEELSEIQGKKVYDPETGKYVVVNEVETPVDTIEWTVVDTEKVPPIISDTPLPEVPVDVEPIDENPIEVIADKVLKDSYKVSMLLPFVKSRFNSADATINKNSLWAVKYYAGAQLALDQLRAEGVNLDVEVMDTEGSDAVTRGLLPRLDSADLVIGPYRSSTARLIAAYTKVAQIPTVVPFSASSSISADNPYLIQVNPQFSSHVEKIVKDVYEKYDTSQVVLITKKSEADRFATFQDVLFQISNDSTARFKEFVIEEESLGLEETDLSEVIAENKKTVFIVPSWSDASFVSSVVRKLRVSKSPYAGITVYGMPQWRNYKNIEFNYYEDLDLHLTTSNFANENDPNVRLFRQRYFDKFGAIAGDEAYLGYDVMLYFGRMLHKNGANFYQFFGNSGVPNEQLHTTFDFAPEYKMEDILKEDNTKIQRFENQHLELIHFSGYHFVKY